MDVKKYDKYRLDKKRILFFQIGFILSLGIVFLAFELITVKERTNENTDIIELDLEFKPIEIVRIEKTEPPEPNPENYKKFRIVDNKTKPEELENSIKLNRNSYVNPENIEIDDEKVNLPAEFNYLNQKPIFKPGKCKTQKESEAEILKFIQKNIKYPAFAKENNIQAKVYVKFLINKEGKLLEPQVINKTNKILEDEALRVVNKLNDWQAGYKNGVPSQMWYTIPIVFQLK